MTVNTESKMNWEPEYIDYRSWYLATIDLSKTVTKSKRYGSVKPGDEFGVWTVISYQYSKKVGNSCDGRIRPHVNVRCSCADSITVPMPVASLKNGKTKHCKFHHTGLNNLVKLTKEDVVDIYSDKRSIVELSKVYPVSASTISKVRRGETWGKLYEEHQDIIKIGRILRGDKV